MNSQVEPLAIRAASADDIEGMRTLLNEIIRVGGTTAITNELSPDEMREWFISGEKVVSCFVAVDSDGTVVGFQSLSTYGTLPAGWVDIATFASRSRHKSGVGSALFARTREAASRLGFSRRSTPRSASLTRAVWRTTAAWDSKPISSRTAIRRRKAACSTAYTSGSISRPWCDTRAGARPAPRESANAQRLRRARRLAGCSDRR